MSIKKKQGDSLWVDVTGDAMDTVDSVWANWTGSYAIVAAVGVTPLIEGSMTKGVAIGVFYVRIGSTAMAALTPGNYYLICQVENTTVDYVQEIVQEKLIISTQGITT